MSYPTNNFAVRPVQDAEWPQVAQLLRRVFKRRFELGELRAKYLSGHGQQASFEPGLSFCRAAWDRERLAAFVGAIPYRLKQCSAGDMRGYDALQVCEFASDPRYRRQGLNHKLLDAVGECGDQHGMDMLFGMGTDLSATALEAHRFEIVHTMTAHALRSGGPPLLRAARRAPGIGRVAMRRARAVLAQVERPAVCWRNPLIECGALAVDHNAAFIEAKRRNGMQLLLIGGVQLWVKVADILFVGAHDASSREQLDIALRKLLRLGVRTGANRVVVHSSPGCVPGPSSSESVESVDSFAVAVLKLSKTVPAAELKLQFLDFETY